MKLVKSLLLVLALPFAMPASAEPLCDPACTLTMSFPGGGSIEAIESAQFHFGDGGLIDTIGSVTAYVDGATRTLTAGEILTFAAGGSLDLGNAGNLEFTNLRIVTDGVVEIAVASDTDQIMFPAGSSLFMSAGSTLVLDGSTTVFGNLHLDGNLIIKSSHPAPPGNDNCGALSTQDNAVTLVTGNLGNVDFSADDLATEILSVCTDSTLTITLQPIGSFLPLQTGTLILNNQPTTIALTDFTFSATETETTPKATEAAADEASVASDDSGGSGATGLLLIALLGCTLMATRRKHRNDKIARNPQIPG